MRVGRLDSEFVVLWAVVVVVGAAAGMVEWRGLARSSARPATRILAALTALLPVLALAISVVAFAEGRIALAQYNTDAAGQRWYAAWVTTWLVLMPALMAAAVSSVALFVARRRAQAQPSGLGWVLVLAACLVGLYGVFWNFPDC